MIGTIGKGTPDLFIFHVLVTTTVSLMGSVTNEFNIHQGFGLSCHCPLQVMPVMWSSWVTQAPS